MDLIITILPVVTKDLPISPRFTPYGFLSRCKFSTLPTRQPMVEFYVFFCILPIHSGHQAGVTQEEGYTGFLIHLLSAVRAFIFLARRIQPCLSLVEREVEFCVLTI